MERDLSVKEALAAVLLLGGAGYWAWLAWHQTDDPKRMLLFSLTGFLLMFSGWGVVRGIAPMIKVVRRSTMMFALLALALVVVASVTGGPDAPLVRARFGPVLLWSAAVAVLLWPRQEDVPQPSAGPAKSKASGKRRKKRRK